MTQKWSPLESEGERGSTIGNEIKSNDTEQEEGGKENRVQQKIYIYIYLLFSVIDSAITFRMLLPLKMPFLWEG